MKIPGCQKGKRRVTGREAVVAVVKRLAVAECCAGSAWLAAQVDEQTGGQTRDTTNERRSEQRVWVQGLGSGEEIQQQQKQKQKRKQKQK